jgi:protein tyrosine phosphatase
MVTATGVRLRAVKAVDDQRNEHSWSHRWNSDGGLHEIPLEGVAGRLWLCGKHVVGPDPEGVLARTGAHTVVCLTERFELADRYPGYVAWLDLHHAHEADDAARAVWFPVHDLHAPPFDIGSAFIGGLARRLRAGRGLVVHCAAGIGRAGTTAVATLVVLGASPESALAHVRAHRPMAGPEVGSQLDFITRLHERGLYESRLQE